MNLDVRIVRPVLYSPRIDHSWEFGRKGALGKCKVVLSCCYWSWLWEPRKQDRVKRKSNKSFSLGGRRANTEILLFPGCLLKGKFAYRAGRGFYSSFCRCEAGSLRLVFVCTAHFVTYSEPHWQWVPHRLSISHDVDLLYSVNNLNEGQFSEVRQLKCFLQSQSVFVK